MPRAPRRSFPHVLTVYLSDAQDERLRGYVARKSTSGRKVDRNEVVRLALDRFLDADDAELRARVDADRIAAAARAERAARTTAPPSPRGYVAPLSRSTASATRPAPPAASDTPSPLARPRSPVTPYVPKTAPKPPASSAPPTLGTELPAVAEREPSAERINPVRLWRGAELSGAPTAWRHAMMGQLMPLPTNAVGWCVRRLVAHAKTEPVLVDGAELVIPPAAKHEHLAAAVPPGTYWLKAVDADGYLLQRVAVVVVAPPPAPAT